MEYKLYVTIDITDAHDLDDAAFDTYYERQLAAVDDSVDYAIAHLIKLGYDAEVTDVEIK